MIFSRSLLVLFFLGFASLVWFGCSKSEDSKPETTAPTGLVTSAATSITASGATIAGSVTTNGGAELSAKGVVYSKTNITPTNSDNVELATGNGVGSFSVSLTGLEPNTKYFARAFASNSVGFSYGSAINFTTTDLPANLPVVTSNASVTAITQTGASFGGNATSDGGSAITQKGVCWNTTGSPTVALSTKTSNGTGTGSFTSTMAGLTAGTTYKVRAYATNANGTSYGSEVTFTTTTTVANPPVVSSNATVTNVTQTSASFGGNVTADGGSAVTQRGVCWNTSGSPTVSLSTKTSDGTGTGSFTSNLSGLTAATTYKVRAYATNANGTAYGAEVSFTTNAASATLTDIDGNVYQTVQIGTQTWMAENLKTTRLKNGVALLTNLNNNDWSTSLNTAYALYDNVAANNAVYGKLYNFYAVETSQLCPAGWHVPTDADMVTLVTFLGGQNQAGGKLKSTSNLWTGSPGPGTNEGGFSALPAGIRDRTTGQFSGLGTVSFFWTSEADGTTAAFRRDLNSANTRFWKQSIAKGFGCSVRCIKD